MVNNNSLVPTENEMPEIKSLIYLIRDKHVMFDSDIASLYNIETKFLNRAVKRNIERFPDDFCFQLTEDEYLRCQYGTSNNGTSKKGGRRYLPYVFTEQGISMLSAVLRTQTAVTVSIEIIRAFVEMRHILSSTSLLSKRGFMALGLSLRQGA